MLSENGLLLLLGTAAILASEFRQGFAERSGLALVFSAERSHLSYSQYELVLLPMWGRGRVTAGGCGSGSVGGKELAGVAAALCPGTRWAVLSEIL